MCVCVTLTLSLPRLATAVIACWPKFALVKSHETGISSSLHFFVKTNTQQKTQQLRTAEKYYQKLHEVRVATLTAQKERESRNALPLTSCYLYTSNPATVSVQLLVVYRYSGSKVTKTHQGN